MPEFRAGQPVVTDTPEVEVTVAANAPLPAGRHRLRRNLRPCWMLRGRWSLVVAFNSQGGVPQTSAEE